MTIVKEYRPQDIRALRKRLKLTQREFAARLGVSAKAVASWEEDTRSPGLASYRKLVALEQGERR